MKPELRRIEAALQEAANQSQGRTALGGGAVGRTPTEQTIVALGTSTSGRFGANSTEVGDCLPTSQVEMLSINTSTTPLGLELGPALPQFAVTPDPQQHFVAFTNSALALNLLKDLQLQVGNWLAQLETTLQQIQSLYQEGPIVDGWLESVNPDQPTHSSYRLCGLNQDGQIWSRPCPAEQVPDISLAIVRYQRLQTLLNQKRHLETRLGYLTQALINMHSQMDGWAE